MSPSPRSPAFEQLAEHVDFVTRLARSLIADEQLAADAAQATFVAALSLPPRRDDNPRAWLATVLRRTVSRIRRSSRRRATREQAVAALAADSATSVVDTVARVAAHRDLANLVLALDEPYRSTVTLRYFDGLSIDEVARATGVPKNTARSRLSRGLARLRAALDGQYGDRAAWAAVVLPLARRSLTVGKAAPAVFAGVLVKKLILAAAAAVLCISVWQFGFAGGGTPAAPPVAGALGSAIPPADLRAAADPPDAAPDRLVAAAPDATSVDAEAANRRLVDVALEPLVGLRMRRESAATVRWQGGDTGWISGPGESLQLAETEIERLRRDPAFATEFFAARRQPEQWRAAILGEPLPDAEVVTDGSGAFAFDVPVAIADVALVEPGWTLVARPRGEVGSFVGTRAVRVCGRLVDPQGGPIGGGFVTVDVAGALPAALGDLAAVDVPEMRSSRDGGFVVRRAPSAPGVVLKARAPGRQTAIVAMPAGDTAVDEFEIRLWPLGDEQRLLVEGVVVDRSQAPVEALVAVGDASVRAAADGRFRLQLDDVEPGASFTVVAAGWQAWHSAGFGALLLADPNAGRQLRIELATPARELRGIVLDPDGYPAAGIGVNLADPTLLDYSFTSVEARAGGRERSIATGADGRFALGGLAQRSYFLRLWDPRTGFLFVDGPFDATNADLTIHLPPAARPRPLRGRVVDSSGQPVPGARAGVAYCVYVGRSGGTMWEDAGLVAVDADGRFELANAPAGGDGVLVAEDAYGRRCYVPLVAIDDFATEIVLRLPGIRGWLWLLPDLADPDLPVTFVDAAGRPLRFTVRDAVGVRPAWRHVVGGPTTVALPDGAVAVVIAAGTAFERRVELDAETTHVHVRGAR